jgi:hypothetical protein
LNKDGPGTGKIIRGEFYDLADFFLNQNPPCGHSYNMTFANFEEGEKFIEDVIRSNQRRFIGGYSVPGRIMVGVAPHEISEPGAGVHKDVHPLPP